MSNVITDRGGKIKFIENKIEQLKKNWEQIFEEKFCNTFPDIFTSTLIVHGTT